MIDQPGVGINNKYAEWNIYIDPVAANIVFKSGIPIVLVPLDATNNVPITCRFYNALGDHLNTPAANLVYDILTANLDFVDSGGFQFWDSLTSAIFTDPSIATFEEFKLIVVEVTEARVALVRQRAGLFGGDGCAEIGAGDHCAFHGRMVDVKTMCLDLYKRGIRHDLSLSLC
ncbi:MAG: hypothetical protein C3F07_08605 [Anaerolineales bacterium]|nr:nucleoside hydrolase [Anaerolineae bacterium]PWB74019.1 MAG: hypothetical protein C3F07_08605 [Anaerolineales bacterium]